VSSDRRAGHRGARARHARVRPDAERLRVRDGRPLVTDGPFAELKEQIGGYYVLECADLDEALRRAATIPSARYGAIEVRPLMVPPDQG
jgi:hypothetical protein